MNLQNRVKGQRFHTVKGHMTRLYDLVLANFKTKSNTFSLDVMSTETHNSISYTHKNTFSLHILFLCVFIIYIFNVLYYIVINI